MAELEISVQPSFIYWGSLCSTQKNILKFRIRDALSMVVRQVIKWKA
jgi:hypothetical protein